MSFSKARLRRFNEEIPQVPSPGRYDPKQDAKVKGAVMPISRRFPNQTCTSSSLDNIEKASTAPEVVFRTPQVMRKIPLTPKAQYLKEKMFNSSGSDILSSDERSLPVTASKRAVSKADYKRLEQELNTLAEKHMKDVLDKDMEIRQLKTEIEEIKTEENKLRQILEEKTKLASDSSNETSKLKVNLEDMVEKIKIDREEHKRYINELESEILALQNKKYELESVLAEKKSIIVSINDKYNDLENELRTLQEERALLEQNNSNVLRLAEEKIDQIENRVQYKLQDLNEIMCIKFEDDHIDFVTRINSATHEFDIKLNEVKDRANKTEGKVKDLERLVDRKVHEFLKDIKEADERCKYLYRELCKVENQRDELVVSDLEKKLALIELQEESNLYRNELDNCRQTCVKYQVTLSTMQETISALSQRLLESESEVERLNVVEDGLESQKKLLEEKTQILLADILALRENMDKMEAEIIQDVTALKEHLEDKADYFKAVASKQVEDMNIKINEKQCEIVELQKENKCFKKNLETQLACIEMFNEKENKYEENIAQLKIENDKLVEELTDKLSAQKNLYTILSAEKERLKTLLIEAEGNLTEKSEELQEITYQLQTLERSLKNSDEKISVIEDEKATLEHQLITAENDKVELQNMNIRVEQDLKQKISDLEIQLRCAKEKIKVEVPKLEHEKINMAENILELNLNIDSLKEELDFLKTNNSCLEAEKNSLNNILEECKIKISEFEEMLQSKNLAIMALNEEKIRINTLYEDTSSQFDSLCTAYDKQNEELKKNSENTIKLMEAEERILDLELLLEKKEKEHEDLLTSVKQQMEMLSRSLDSTELAKENEQLKEELEVLSEKYHTVVDDREKLNRELGDLMGHQNIHQKIKHVNKLKQDYIELKNEVEQLRIENLKLRKKISENESNKENVIVSRKESGVRVNKPNSTKKKPMSPGVLKPSNH